MRCLLLAICLLSACSTQSGNQADIKRLYSAAAQNHDLTTNAVIVIPGL